MRRLKDKFWNWLFHYKHGMAGRRTPLSRVMDFVFFPRDCVVAVRGYRRTFGRTPDLFRPQLFNECLQRRKLFERDPRFTILADKLAVRKHVAEKVGDKYLTKIYWTGTDLLSARQFALPKRFVVKANHSTRTNLIVSNAEEFSWADAAAITQKWLTRDLSFATAEWHYRWIPPTIFIEEYLEARPGTTSLTDYKFFVFHGRTRAVQVIYDRFGDKVSYLLDPALQPIEVGARATTPLPVEKPRATRLGEMIEVAERLALSDIAFQRVDLYEVSGRVIFGEITFVPTAGLKQWDPPDVDEYFGRMYLGAGE